MILLLAAERGNDNGGVIFRRQLARPLQAQVGRVFESLLRDANNLSLYFLWFFLGFSIFHLQTCFHCKTADFMTLQFLLNASVYVF